MKTPEASSVDRITAALQACYASIEALCADLGHTEWEAQSLCPDWTVRDVIDHVTSIEAVMWILRLVRATVPLLTEPSFR